LQEKFIDHSVALEYAEQHVRINAVAAGAIETRMFRDFASAPQVQQTLVSAIPIGRIGQPKEIASTMLALFRRRIVRYRTNLHD
jgi:NAD(P)-dependent dehydrogenase (short-subunit alcohol dehydrogenase family)